MAIISIKRYLDVSFPEAHLRMLELLVQTVTEHPIDIDHAECERFKSEVAKIQETFGAEADGEQFSQAVEAISQALERHHRSVSNLVQSQGSELQNMITMMAQTIRSLGSASDVSARN